MSQQDSNVPNLAETMEEPQHTCPHDYKYDEQIGIYCYRCGDVKTEIQYVTAPFVSQSSRLNVWFEFLDALVKQPLVTFFDFPLD